MLSLNLKSLLFSALLLSAGCQMLVDADPKEIGTGALKDACQDVDCKAGTHCALIDVQCIKAPCDPVAQCIADDLGAEPIGDGDGDGDTGVSGQACGKSVCGEGTVCCNASCGICTKPGGVCIQLACDEEPSKPTCAATLCKEGTVCVEGPNGAECKPQQEPSSCALALCPKDTYCDDISGQATCLPLPSCDGTKCDEGMHCELQEVTCVRAPCPPQPTCVKDVDPCATIDCAGECKVVKGKPFCSPTQCKDPCLTVKCSAGHHCEAKQVQCITDPCCPVAECVSDKGGQACGDNTCSAGTYCCNESCGICAPKGGACTQQFCGQED
jgi:hypothetical protein